MVNSAVRMVTLESVYLYFIRVLAKARRMSIPDDGRIFLLRVFTVRKAGRFKHNLSRFNNYISWEYYLQLYVLKEDTT